MTMRILQCFCLVLWLTTVHAQTSQLANEYYLSGEYEKAASIFKKLYDKQPRAYYYFDRYIECLIATEDYGQAEQSIREHIKDHPEQVQFYVTLGHLKERQFLPEEADEAYRMAIENIPPDVSIISNLGNTFTRTAKYDMAVEVFERGGKIMKNDELFAYNLAGLYKRMGEIPNMIKYYLIASKKHPNQLERYKTFFQKNLETKEDLDEMRKQVYVKIQEDPDNEVYPELLEWIFIEMEDYRRAFRQARSLDRKYEEEGFRVQNIGRIAYQAGDYDTAIAAFEYVAENKSLNNKLYVEAKRTLLKAKRKKVTSSYDYSQGEFDTLKTEYTQFIDEFGVNGLTQNLVKEYADFLALYLNDLDESIIVLSDLISYESISPYVKADAKLSLADYYLMKDEIWEATLLYSQVEKAFKEEYMGEIARFKNAKLFYFAGNFPWAQEQFDILKSATSKLISNDAIDLSVFIMDNMGLDTTDYPLKLFAQSELLTIQNKYDEAFAKLDSINLLFPDHALTDDILYQKANLHMMLKDYTTAETLLKRVYTEYPEEIRADNAMYLLAQLYEYQLERPEDAKLLYEKLFIDFSDSSFAVEARKRFRVLRGDDVQ